MYCKIIRGGGILPIDSDKVFTPPKIANQVLDLLPEEV